MACKILLFVFIYQIILFNLRKQINYSSDHLHGSYLIAL